LALRLFTYISYILLIAIWLVLVEWSFYLVICVGYLDGGSYGTFHKKVHEELRVKPIVKNIKLACGTIFEHFKMGLMGFYWGKLSTSGDGSATAQGVVVIGEAGLPPHIRCVSRFILLVLLIYSSTGSSDI
jgi:hypothetical protein